MSHALNLPILAADGDRVPFHADPILAAIERHEEAYAVFQVAPEGRPSEVAEEAMSEALTALLATPCATRAGMLCLIRHLRWWVGEEAPFSEDYQPGYGIAQAREADLSRCLGVERIERLPLALPSGRLIGPVLDLRPEPIPTAHAVALPAPALIRTLSQAGDALAALILIVGGCGFVGFASLF